MVGNESALVLAGRTAGDWENANAGGFDFMAAKFTADGAEQWRFQVGVGCEKEGARKEKEVDQPKLSTA